MADKDGKLSKSDRDAVARFLDQKKAQPECPSCGTKQWEIASHLVEMGAYVGNAPRPQKIVLPAVVLMCTNCAFMRLHSAVLAGIVEPDKPEEEGATVGAGKADTNG
jgi:hypothetical protein